MCLQVGVFSTLLSRPRDTTWAPVGHLSVTGGMPVTVRSFFAWAFGGSWYINLDSATQTGMVAWPTGTSVVIQSVGPPGGWDGRGRTGATPCGSGGSGVSPPDIFRVPQPFALGCAELVHFGRKGPLTFGLLKPSAEARLAPWRTRTAALNWAVDVAGSPYPFKRGGEGGELRRRLF